jgi:uncharacterized membrane protein
MAAANVGLEHDRAARRSAGRAPNRVCVGPGGFVALVGGCVGLVFLLLAPPWAGGADEGTHFARALDMTNGHLTPGSYDGEVGSMIPASYEADQDEVVATLLVTSPWGNDLLGRLLGSRPDWDDTGLVDTRPTTAATPVAYAPSAMAMSLPNALGWPGITVVWAGRLGDLAVYLGLVLLAVSVATAFRWTIALTAVFPMNLAIASSITPDALTIAALLLVIGTWTRVWTRHTGSVRHARVPPLDEDLSRRKEIDWAAVVWVVASGLLLALSKAPYFLVLGVFPALLLVDWRDRTVRISSLAAAGAGVIGVAVSLLGRADYEPATAAFGDPINYQPDVQTDRILGDPIGFVWTLVGEWVTSLPEIVQRWTNQVGVWNSKLPIVVSLLIVASFLVAAMILDRGDLLRLRRVARAIWVVGWTGLVAVVYTSAYIYFDDTVDGVHIGGEAPRYIAPLLGAAVLGLAPRWALRSRAAQRFPRNIAMGAVVVAELVAVVAITAIWLRTGNIHDPT